MNEEIKLGYQIKKPIITQEECNAYSACVEVINKHNESAQPGEVTWTMEDKSDYYEVVESGVIPSEEDNLEEMKTSRVAESKSVLTDFLASHPIQWSDGKYYSVTTEKQSLLTSNLALYQISTAAGLPFKLTWNSTGDECVDWTYENLAALALAIGTYVKPFVSHQQELELAIKAASTMDELESIEISYDDTLIQVLNAAADKEVA